MKTNQVPDIGEMLKFWEMKEGITSCLVVIARLQKDEDLRGEMFNLINKIESLGKKDGG